jgi:mono/diheme cytochrome c family protein
MGSAQVALPMPFKQTDAAQAKLDIMKLKFNAKRLLPSALVASLICLVPAMAQNTAPAPSDANFDPAQLFATTCGWCHSDGGRAAGKGPQLMESPRDDDYLRNRIKNGKNGAMPAFGAAFSDAQIDDIIKYIRALKPHQG